MQKLLSLPPNLVNYFHDITGYDKKEFFCSNDPVGCKLGSGGGTVWLLESCYRNTSKEQSFEQWLDDESRILIHAGGQSRRLPGYAPSGKILTPIPIFKWERGQKLSQDLLSLQLPLYEKLMEKAPKELHTMVVSGDVYIRTDQPLPNIPKADVVCFGLWLNAETAKNHGVFVASREKPNELKQMLQKPSVEKLGALQQKNLYLTDIGIWLLSDKAVMKLRERSTKGGKIGNYDLYGEFGCSLGTNPTIEDEGLKDLTVAILPLPGGEFYHYGTSREIISSTLSIQNIIHDQRLIMHNSQKPHPAMFIQNAQIWTNITANNQNLWIENSYISEDWSISHENIITGVPDNQWNIKLKPCQCVDIIPIADQLFAVRPYGFYDAFRGDIKAESTSFLQKPFKEWAAERGIDINEIKGKNDLQTAEIFPLVENTHDMGIVLRWMLNEPELQGGKSLWQNAKRMSADSISEKANLKRLFAMREQLRAESWISLAKNYSHSVFYQTDLQEAAHDFATHHFALPTPLNENEALITRIHDAMFRSEVQKLKGKDYQEYENKAFKLLSSGMLNSMDKRRQNPVLSVAKDQIVWGRSPVRIDLAGGWSDTPPYCMIEGGKVVNMAIELNGQPPLQTYVKPCKEYHIILRSIDLGASETITDYKQLADFHHVGSPFSIPKAALVLSGFHPDYSVEKYQDLQQQLQAFGCGIEITLLAAIPAGSGLGTSSLLSSTVLGALSNFCGLTWTKSEIGIKALMLEQLLTTGGGWQDQFGGLMGGVKMLETEKGLPQNPQISWLPSQLFTLPEYKSCHLLYYTGITRTAKSILSEIVRRMFLNQHEELAILREMKMHALDMRESILRQDFKKMGTLVRKTWRQKQAIDPGANPQAIAALTRKIDDYCLGYKLPGAGGGGYLYMVAKDPDAAARIKKALSENTTYPNARFVDMQLSKEGLQISRS